MGDRKGDENFSRKRKTTTENNLRNLKIAETQLIAIKRDWDYLYIELQLYRKLMNKTPRNYDELILLEKKIDRLIEEYAKSKIYILQK